MLEIRNIVLLVLLLTGANAVFAQKNALKIGLIGPTIGNYSLGLEQVIHTSHTMNVNVGYWNSNAGLLGIGILFEEGKNIWLQSEGKGWHGSVEMRNYFDVRQGNVTHKFYWGPYIRFWKKSLLMNDYIQNELVTQQQLFDVNTLFKGIGIGAQLGYHLMLTDRLWLDFYFLGLGIEWVKMTAEYKAVGVENFEYSFIEGDVRDAFSDKPGFIKDKVMLSSTPQWLLIELPVTLPAFRAGVNIAFTID